MTMMIYQLSNAVAGVTVAEAKAWARIDDEYEDEVVAMMIVAATSEAEHRLQREVIYRNDPEALAKTISAVPADVKSWICARVTAMFDERNAETPVQWNTAKHLDHLLDRYMIHDRDPDFTVEESSD